MVAQKSSESIKAVELFAPVRVFGYVGHDFPQHFFGVGHWSQLIFGNVLGGFIIDLIVFFLLLRDKMRTDTVDLT
jgi:hypothetical protein